MAPDPRILGIGGSAIVSIYDENTVLKGYVVWLDGEEHMAFEKQEHSRRALQRERQVYERLGFHPALLGYYGVVDVKEEVHSLRLELAVNGDVRAFIRKNKMKSTRKRLSWAVGLASGLSHMHSHGIIHCDFSCRNIFITKDFSVKIGDFGGAKLDDQEPLDSEEPCYELPLRGRTWEERPYLKRELFALGCAIYEIMAWTKPFDGLSNEDVEARYSREEFPGLTDVFGESVIRKCWEEEFNSADDVKYALEALSVASEEYEEEE
ncbi:kinase-like protein [Microthyrium microscopicum]|uniref:EKC/KEOPS complex subunit BUD32 n=1 Tax=Microthyrium microscopicum TaxID=703497 RepID=A0A6A6URQ5_9PEZI|nr:kinase-like protein [Microthyrium microscopicum]